MDETAILKEWLAAAEHAVFFGGAGVSTASGIPDFRGNGGLYTTGDSPEYLISRTCLRREPQKFFTFYRTKMCYPDALPNEAHRALAALEATGRIRAVVTQNIDGLHQKAGSRQVYELHGTTARQYCDVCGKRFAAEYGAADDVPHCDVCGGVVRPDVVLYEEGLDAAVWDGAARAIAQADLLIVGGTSLVVQPAASLVGGFTGRHLVIVNLTPTPYDAAASLVIRRPIEEVLAALV